MHYDLDTQIYDKRRLGYGFDRRPNNKLPSSFIAHTTNNKHKDTSFTKEAEYIYESRTISAHYLIGKSEDQGIVQFLPEEYRAWHAGRCIAGFGNAESIGVEMHVSVGEKPTSYQIDALAWLARRAMARWGFGTAKIETHRKVALPPGRKSDPAGWNDLAFYGWRASLAAPQTTEPIRRYKVRTDTLIGATVRTEAREHAARLRAMPAGAVFSARAAAGDRVSLPGFGTSNAWLKIEDSDGGGFVWQPLCVAVL